jgi:hypothetical protein
MTSLILTLVALLAVVLAVQGVIAWQRWRGTRLVTCPETRKPAAVEMDLPHAVLGAMAGRPDLRLSDCSRWPERGKCGQPCLTQVEEAPHDCLVFTLLEGWYAGRSCVYCGKRFGLIHWHDHRPGLRAPDGRLVEWKDVPPQTFPDVLATHQAVCWNCLVAEGFRLKFPDLVVDRAGHPRGDGLDHPHHGIVVPPPS